jgi:hypothetical protein
MNIEGFKKWSKSLFVALCIFFSATFVSIVIGNILNAIGDQYVNTNMVESQVPFNCRDIAYNGSSEMRNCNLGDRLLLSVFADLLYLLLLVGALMAPVTAIFGEDGIDGGLVAISVASYVGVFILTLYLSQIFDKDDKQIFEDKVRKYTKRAWLMTLAIMMIIVSTVMISSWIK